LLEAAYACLLLSPQVPLLFNGEEFAASTPFLFFCDFNADLAPAVREGRRAEFARFAAFGDATLRARIPDPGARATFNASKLRWQECDEAPHGERLAFIRRLLTLRRQHLVPRLAGRQPAGSHRHEAGLIRVEWLLGDGSPWHLIAHFGHAPASTGAAPEGKVIYSRGVAQQAAGMLELQPGGVLVARGSHHGQG
jgi:maltooligosyltrehalose trehalohydrolase